MATATSQPNWHHRLVRLTLFWLAGLALMYAAESRVTPPSPPLHADVMTNR